MALKRARASSAFLPRNSSPGRLLPGLPACRHFRPVFLVVREGDDLRAPLCLDGEVELAHGVGRSALFHSELVGRREVFQRLPHLLLLPLLVAKEALKRRL